jgi:hypothetical protein
MSVRTGKSRGLLGDPNIAAWYSNLCEGSEITADVYLRRLGRFCEENNQTPQNLAGMDAKTAFNTLVTAVRKYRDIGFAGSMIKWYVKAVKSWLSQCIVAVRLSQRAHPLVGDSCWDSQYFRKLRDANPSALKCPDQVSPRC